MSEEPKDFAIGFTDETKETMLLFIPIRAYTDHPDGTALLRGKLEEAKQIALLHIQENRKRKELNGLVKPGTIPLKVN